MPPFYERSAQSPSSPAHTSHLRSLIPSTFHIAPRSPLSTVSTLPTSTSEPIQYLTRSLSSIFRRQVDPSVIPTTYSGLNAGPTPGTVVGIVFGSVAGFLLVLGVIYTFVNGIGKNRDTSSIEEEVVVRRRSRSPRRSSPRRSSPRRSSPRRSSPRRAPSSHSRSEVIEVSRHRSPPRRETRRETVILEETRRPAPREDDIVEVIEDHSPPRRVKRESSRRESGYRTVDPEAFGGGSRPLRKVSRR